MHDWKTRKIAQLTLWIKHPENAGVLAIAGIVLVLHFVALFQVDDHIYDGVIIRAVRASP